MDNTITMKGMILRDLAKFNGFPAIPYLPQVAVNLVDHRRGGVTELPCHSEHRYGRTIVHRLQPSTTIGVSEELGADSPLREPCLLADYVELSANVRQE
jgi:hypothetical protein